MSDAIWVAIIGAIGVIVAALMTAILRGNRKPQVVDVDSNTDAENSMSETTKRNITQVYRTVLERSPDAVGLGIYGGQLQRDEKTLQEIVREVGKSREYFDRFVSPFSPKEVVRFLYRHFLCRDPENEDIINEHVRLFNSKGWQYNIDKLVGSEEYKERFGSHSPPC